MRSNNFAAMLIRIALFIVFFFFSVMNAAKGISFEDVVIEDASSVFVLP